MSTREDVVSYRGSGTIWTKHLKEHKVEPIHVWHSKWYYDESIQHDALTFSRNNDIVNSVEWANMIFEDGINKGWVMVNLAGKNLYGYNGRTPNVVDNLNRGRVTHRNKLKDPVVRKKYIAKLSSAALAWHTTNTNAFKGKTHTAETKRVISEKNSVYQKGQGNSQFGSFWITNGVESKKWRDSENIPCGWSRGRKVKNVVYTCQACSSVLGFKVRSKYCSETCATKAKEDRLASRSKETEYTDLYNEYNSGKYTSIRQFAKTTNYSHVAITKNWKKFNLSTS